MKGQGIARDLPAEVEKQFGEKFWLYTWVKNESNGFYTHLGFKQIGLYNFEFAEWAIENNVPEFSRT